ncbi:MAG: hypothetical protein F4X36_19510 [Gammaproteobacteria bacterium]|nr:hypothetical protein [Gammaproteobacteria bacterium]
MWFFRGWGGSPFLFSSATNCRRRAAARADNAPLFMHYQVPTSYHFHSLPGAGMFRDAEFGSFLPYTDMPVVRTRSGMRRTDIVADSQLFHLGNDPGQTRNLVGKPAEARYVDLLRRSMERVDAPPSQFERLGL